MNTVNLIKAILFAIISAIIATPLQILNSIYILKDEAPPELSFLIPVALISILMKTLYASAYVLLGKKLPIKSERLRAFVFIIIIWVSDYLPQVLGLIGADGPIAEIAFNIPIVICDSLSYFLDGFLLGFFFKNIPYYEIKKCKKLNLFKTMAISGILFPLSVLIFEQLLGFVYSPLYTFNAMKVSETHKILFSISFYGCFIITGALLPLIFRYTEYNEEKSASPLYFGSIYAFCLWSPVVLIMVAFGMSIIPVLIYIVVFYICITVVSILNSKLIFGYIALGDSGTKRLDKMK